MTRQSRLTYQRTLTPAEIAEDEARREQELSALFAGGSCYGVADWPGTRAVVGSGWGGGGFRSIELMFGDEHEPGGSVSVVTVVADRFTIKIGELCGLAGGPGSRPSRDYEAVAAEPAEEVTFLVDDRPAIFRLWRHGPSDVAAALLGERGIVLAIRDVPLESIRLSRVDDLGPFLSGRRERTAKYRREANGT